MRLPEQRVKTVDGVHDLQEAGIVPGIDNLAWNIDACEILQWCHDHGVRYINTSTELWDPYATGANAHPTTKTLYYRHMNLRRMLAKWKTTIQMVAIGILLLGDAGRKLTAGFYGHCSVGCLHIRPFVDLSRPDEVARMRTVAVQIKDLVREFGGVARVCESQEEAGAGPPRPRRSVVNHWSDEYLNPLPRGTQVTVVTWIGWSASGMKGARRGVGQGPPPIQ